MRSRDDVTCTIRRDVSIDFEVNWEILTRLARSSA
jgi:hypothetical protein